MNERESAAAETLDALGADVAAHLAAGLALIARLESAARDASQAEDPAFAANDVDGFRAARSRYQAAQVLMTAIRTNGQGRI